MGRHIILRILDFTVDAVLWACGVLLITFGSIGVSNVQATINLLNLIPGVIYVTDIFNVTPMFNGVSIFMIVLGCFLFICGGVGLAGHLRRDKRIGFGYAGSLLCCILTEIALIIYAAVYPSSLEGWIQSEMYSSLSSFDSVIITPATGLIIARLNSTASGWENLQFQTHCCGAYGPTDFMNFTQWNRDFVINGIPVSATYPPSCCPQSGVYGVLPTNVSQIPNLASCMTTSPNIQQSCSSVVVQMAWNFNYISIIISSCLIAAEILGLIFTLRVVRFNERD